MKNKDGYQEEQNQESTEIFIAKLSLVGTTLSTLGDAIQTVAAGIVLQELEKANNQKSQNKSDQSQVLESMQTQIDQLNRKIDRMERKKR